mmetsp:Transcript_61345/g.144761  ORF Transcript_61345/g.144761 Transcript_61345/m.144761 type:complete len:267 (+) Transcript_61345:189-989(+)
MICVECGQPVNNVHYKYRGGSIRLTICEFCHNVADKYVEHELVIIFLDLVLHKAQAYRHLIFNRMEYCESGLQTSDFQLVFYIIIMEAYSKTRANDPQEWSALAEPDQWQGYAPSLAAWSHFGVWVAVCTVQMVLYCLASVAAARLLFSARFPIVKYNYLVKCVILANFGRCFYGLLLVWDYDHPAIFDRMVDLFVFSSSFVAVRVWTGSGAMVALYIVLAGWSARLAVQQAVLHAGWVLDPPTQSLLVTANFAARSLPLPRSEPL